MAPIWRHTVAAIAVLLLTAMHAERGAGAAFEVQQTCAGREQFFDISGLTCHACGPHEVKTPSGTGCACEAGFAPSSGLEDNHSCINCTAKDMGVSLDGYTCIACDSSSGAFLDTKTGQCTCGSNNSALVEFDGTQKRLSAARCEACASGSYAAKAAPSFCQACPSPQVYSEEVGKCKCPSRLPKGTVCSEDPSQALSALAQSLGTNLQSSNVVKYYDVPLAGGGSTVKTLESALFLETFIPAATECRDKGDRVACNALANLCVLQLYDKDSAACRAFIALSTQRQRSLYHSTNGWSDTMPWLYYAGDPRSWLDSTDVQARVSFHHQPPLSGKIGDVVVVLSAFALNGTWLGFQNLTSECQLCGTPAADANAWQRFGTSFVNDCEIPFRSVAARRDASEPVFYDAYLLDGRGALYPIPVKILNYRESGGQLVNLNQGPLGEFSTVLTRRFFVADFVSGATSTDASSSSPSAAATDPSATATKPLPAAVRFLESFLLTVRLRRGVKARIYPPSITLRYQTRDPLYGELIPNKASFRVSYTMDFSGVWSSWMIAVIVTVIFAFGLWCYRMLGFFRRRQSQNLDTIFLYHAIVHGCSVIAWLFFLLCLGASLYWFAFFKLQADVFSMLPGNAQLGPFRIILVLAFVAQTLSIADVTWRQVCYDVVFLDWEKPHTVVGPGGVKERAPVSVWRTLFVANEWNELQTRRKSCPEMTLALVLVFLSGLGLYHWAAAQPTLATAPLRWYQEGSDVLAFAVAATLWLIVGGTQVLFQTTIGHRFVEHPLLQFVDLLSLANVSVLILDTRFSGYYLHGRSVYAAADTSMEELNAELRKEQDGLVSARGLDSGANNQQRLRDNQVFEIFITPELRTKYDSTFGHYLDEERRRKHKARGYMPKGLAPPQVAQKATVRAQEEVSSLFRHFINQVEADVSRRVLEKNLVQQILNLPPDMTQTHSPVFFHDFQNLFGRVTLYGIEMELMLFELLLYAVTDLAARNPAVSLFVSYSVSRTIRMVRHSLGENNISRKSLVDSRFLI